MSLLGKFGLKYRTKDPKLNAVLESIRHKINQLISQSNTNTENLQSTEDRFTITGVVSPTNSLIIPFYFPEDLLDIDYIYLNIYFPGLENGDYPSNSTKLYLRPSDRGSIVYDTGGSWVSIESEYHLDVGTIEPDMLERTFLRYLISSLAGFNLDICKLKWTLYSEATTGGTEDEDAELAEVQDFGVIDKNVWSTSVNHDYSIVMNHGATTGIEYSQDVSSRIATLLSGGTDYACYRYKGDEENPSAGNANFFRMGEPLMYAELSEDTSASVTIKYDNGDGTGFHTFNSYGSDAELTDLSAYFSGSGKKQLKFTCNKTRRIQVALRIGLLSE